MKRNEAREKKSKTIMIDNREKLQELSSKAKTSLYEKYKTRMEGTGEKKRKRDALGRQEDQKEDSSILKRKKY